MADVLVESQNSPSRNLGVKNYLGPTLKFLYCFSLGYRKVFEQYAAVLRQKYPEIGVEGDMYPPPDYKVMLARALGAVKMLLVIYILGIVNIFNFLGLQEPSWWTWCTRNKLCILLDIVYQKQAVHFGGHDIPETSCASWWTWCTRNKLCSCIMIFFVCSAVEGQLLSTAAI